MEPTGAALTLSTTNGIDLNLTDVSAVTLWPQRAGARAGRFAVTVTSNQAVTITLAGTFGSRVLRIPAGTVTRLVTL
jgi:hypothetical protein